MVGVNIDRGAVFNATAAKIGGELQCISGRTELEYDGVARSREVRLESICGGKVGGLGRSADVDGTGVVDSN